MYIPPNFHLETEHLDTLQLPSPYILVRDFNGHNIIWGCKDSKPWCKDAIKQRKHALSNFCRYPTKENLNKVKNLRAKARRTTKASKLKSWKFYVSNLNHKTPIKKKVWDMIRKISGKSKSTSFTHLNTKRGTKATSKEKIANTLGETFLDKISSRNYSEKFQNIKKQEEKIKLNFTSSNTEEYNSLFNITELKHAIHYQKIQLQALMTSITRCLNTFPKPPLTHFYIFSTVYGQQGFFMPPTSKKLEGHIASGLSVRPFVTLFDA